MPKTINICSGQAEDIQQLLPNEVLISIGEEYGDFWKLQVDGERVLKLRFSDVRAIINYKGNIMRPISVEQAHEIISFIQKWEGYDILVNCAASVNRSASISMFLHLFFGYELKPNFYRSSEGNPFVLGVLIQEYMKLKNGIYNNDFKFSF